MSQTCTTGIKLSLQTGPAQQCGHKTQRHPSQLSRPGLKLSLDMMINNTKSVLASWYSRRYIADYFCRRFEGEHATSNFRQLFAPQYKSTRSQVGWIDLLIANKLDNKLRQWQ